MCQFFRHCVNMDRSDTSGSLFATIFPILFSLVILADTRITAYITGDICLVLLVMTSVTLVMIFPPSDQIILPFVWVSSMAVISMMLMTAGDYDTIMNLNLDPDLRSLWPYYVFYHTILHYVYHLQNINISDGLFGRLGNIVPGLFNVLRTTTVKQCDVVSNVLKVMVTMIKILAKILVDGIEILVAGIEILVDGMVDILGVIKQALETNPNPNVECPEAWEKPMRSNPSTL